MRRMNYARKLRWCRAFKRLYGDRIANTCILAVQRTNNEARTVTYDMPDEQHAMALYRYLLFGMTINRGPHGNWSVSCHRNVTVLDRGTE